MAIYCRGSNVAEIYRRVTKVLQVYKKGALVYDAGGGEAFGGYVKEGLVLQLDCRRIDIENLKWKNEVSNLIFSIDDLAKIAPSGAITASEGTASASAYHEDEDDQTPLIPLDFPIEPIEEDPYYKLHDLTIEIVTNGGKTPRFEIGYGGAKDGNSRIIAATNNTGIACCFGTEGNWTGIDEITEEGVISASLSIDKIYINAEIVESTSSGSTLVYRSYSPTIDLSFEEGCEVYAIRVYNRPLTDDEREHNRQKDIENFGGQPPVVDRVFADEFSDEFE